MRGGKVSSYQLCGIFTCYLSRINYAKQFKEPVNSRTLQRQAAALF